MKIFNKFLEYFQDSIEINIIFEGKGQREQILIKKEHCLIHDLYIIINKKYKSEVFFDIGLEYFETIHNKILDNDKKIHSSYLLDFYDSYKERNGNMTEFTEKLILEIFTIISSLNLDPYTLSKINYFYENKDDDNLELNTNIFNNIIDIKINKKFDLKDFFDEIQPTNPDNGDDFTYKEFISYIKRKKINITFLNNNICDISFFDKIIMYLDIDCSEFIKIYKEIYMKAMNMIFSAYNQIITHVLSKNEYKNNLKIFMDNFIVNHMVNYNSISHINHFKNELIDNEIEINDSEVKSITIFKNDSNDRKNLIVNAIKNINKETDIQINFINEQNINMYKNNSEEDKNILYQEINNHNDKIIFTFDNY
jgi:hypothetical protein